MNLKKETSFIDTWPKLGEWPLPGKALATMIILMIALGLCVSIGQIIIHDIIPTFLSEKEIIAEGPGIYNENVTTRGDLFSNISFEEDKKSFYQTDEFIFALKFTHIHIFGMSMIFIFMGGIAIFLDINSKALAWLIVLPFIGIIIDLTAVWLKLFVTPAFFWLHIAGFGIFGTVFAFVSGLALWQMWWHS